MKHFILSLVFGLVAFGFSGCLTSPVSSAGGGNGVTVINSNVDDIINAARTIFAQNGYSPGPANYPDSVSFDKPAGGFGKLMYGSYGVTTTFRVKMSIIPIPGTNNFRLTTSVSRVSDAGEAGFEDSQKMMGLWSGEFKPLLQKISAQTTGLGPA